MRMLKVLDKERNVKNRSCFMTITKNLTSVAERISSFIQDNKNELSLDERNELKQYLTSVNYLKEDLQEVRAGLIK